MEVGATAGHHDYEPSKKTNKMEEKIMAELVEIKSLTLLASKNVLTIDDVSLLTGISKSTLYKMTCKKLLPHYKPNSKLLFFNRQEIEEWAQQNRVMSQQEAEQKALTYSVTNRIF
jgi:excisionase family DNA binding protein